ncbi:Nucleic acid-binding, OB-fold [Plasmopara halstedii]|uniref:Nucleic acid-binding, OB-fold n=1 Tax=Plasmopara halstedii TaxID=4781 RepID=A0A0P1B1D7_PLAHL|nr:Nucleic acid-binding, OB-fold [Plasmopara halstedii]CEG47524.1 Nucleic acid-binding, OB-fold [Plasmopara halstedii]|eukprot:XP_024583893.1 Nucleic acid-binding, OB-fold [Plasmopara halstedii]
MSPDLLTMHGVRQLYHSTVTDDPIKLQVLGIYRYLADPELKDRLGQLFVDAHDVFDVLLSDGCCKMKAILAQKYNKFVYKRVLTPRCIMRVDKFKVFKEDKQHTYRVILLQDLAIASLNDDGANPDKVVTCRCDQTTNHLDFVSTIHLREVALLPLTGGRLYYLSLRSDDYTLDWACSFTDGKPDEDSPLDELECNWPKRCGAYRLSGNQQLLTSSVSWNSDRNYCSNLFTPRCNKLYTILEALSHIKKNKQQGVRQNFNVPMLGAIRVKSKVRNLGDPNIANPFPFAFNAVVVDATGVFEVMFFGSMCAKYYLSLQEGDLIQFRGYTAATTQQHQWLTTTGAVLWYPDTSSGQAYHIPAKYWKVLELSKMIPRMLGDLSTRKASSYHPHQSHPTWLECNFVTTLNTRYLKKKASNHLDAMYFDFIGVLSSVGRICRARNKNTFEVCEYRWLKMIDSSSLHELVIKIGTCSQPAIFRALEAGNTLLLTKLQWVVLLSGDTDAQIQYARTSDFSILRINEAVFPFRSLEECNLNVYFAQTVNKNAVLESRKVSGESKLTAHIETKYRPLNRLPTNVQHFKNAFGLCANSFNDLLVRSSKLEVYEHQHVGFIGQISAIRYGDKPADDESTVLLEINEAGSPDQILTVIVSINELFQRPIMKEHILAATPSQSLSLLCILPATLLDEMYSEIFRDEIVYLTRRKMRNLSLDVIKNYLVCLKHEFFFSLHLYSDRVCRVTWKVDAILAMTQPS